VVALRLLKLLQLTLREVEAAPAAEDGAGLAVDGEPPGDVLAVGDVGVATSLEEVIWAETDN
jgi:hypothetical protein